MKASEIRIVDLAITARYQGERRLQWRVEGSGDRYFVKISANPVAVDLSAIDVLFRLPPQEAQRGDPDWFEVERLTTSRWMRFVRAAWKAAEAQDLFSAEAFARADAKRRIEAEIQRRAVDLYARLSNVVVEYDGTSSGDDFYLTTIDEARALLRGIEAEAAETYESVLKALQGALKKAQTSKSKRKA